ncbi:MAG: hypothetical protein GY730_04820, partial [bacterium]|nr:hypothetical protein [bacterium]
LVSIKFWQKAQVEKQNTQVDKALKVLFPSQFSPLTNIVLVSSIIQKPGQVKNMITDMS